MSARGRRLLVMMLGAVPIALATAAVQPAHAAGQLAPRQVHPDCNNVTPAAGESGAAAVWTQTAEISGSGRGRMFARALSVSADGSTALVGLPGNGSDKGHAAVYTEAGGSWTQTASLVGADTVSGDSFGQTVSLSGDGATALVGAPGADGGVGESYVFVDVAGVWQQSAELIDPDGAGSRAVQRGFGTSVALSSDASAAIIGAPISDAGGNGYGAAFVFGDVGGQWQSTAKVSHPGAFGSSVSMSGDGSSAAIGAPLHNQGIGAAFVYTDVAGTWTRTSRFVRKRVCSFNDHFGDAVALSADGATVAVGEDAHGNYSGETQGAVHLYSDSSGTWRDGKVVEGTSANGLFGWSVGLSADGTSLAVGAPAQSTAQGGAFVFTLEAGGWHRTQLATSDGGPSDRLGDAIAISADGATVVAGAPGTDQDLGAAYVFSRS